MKEKNSVRRSARLRERWRFLAGNIAKGGVINVISRKAISPLSGTVSLQPLFDSVLTLVTGDTKVAGGETSLHGISEKYDCMLIRPDHPVEVLISPA